MGLPEFDEDVILALATDASYDRGSQYADGGAVRNLMRAGETYRAEVYAPNAIECGSAECPLGPPPAAADPVAADPGRADALLAVLSAERLRAFVRQQVAEYPGLIERFVLAFASDTSTGALHRWQRAFHAAVKDGQAAETALCCIDAIELDDCDPDRAGVLFHLLELSGDTDRFLRVGRDVVRQRPGLAPPLVRKLIELGERDKAVEVAEEALRRLPDNSASSGYLEPGSFTSSENREAREALLRYLVGTCDPRRERDRILAHARALVFDYDNTEDYGRLRELLATDAEIDKLLRHVADRCSPQTVTEVLGAERRWDALLAYAREHTDDERAFPRMIRRPGCGSRDEATAAGPVHGTIRIRCLRYRQSSRAGLHGPS